MLIRLINLALAIVAVCGGVMAIKQQRQIAQIQGEHQRLETIAGVMPISDEYKIHVLAIDTGDPLHFLWRVYLPAKTDMRWRLQTAFGSSGSNSHSGRQEPQQFYARVRLRKIGKQLMLFRSAGSGSGSSTIGGPEAAISVERPDLLQVEQLARNEVLVLDTDELIPLLQVQLRPEARQEIGEGILKRLRPDRPMIEFTAGSKAAFAKASAGQTP